jgi:hypothetical protein
MKSVPRRYLEDIFNASDFVTQEQNERWDDYAADLLLTVLRVAELSG